MWNSLQAYIQKSQKKPRLFETLDNNINRIIDLTNEINIIENHIKK